MNSPVRTLVLGPGPDAKGGITALIGTMEALGCGRRFATTNGEGAGRWVGTIGSLARFPAALRGVDVAHVHTAGEKSFWRKLPFIQLAFLYRKPVVLHVHPLNFWDWWQALPAPGRLLVARVLRRAASVIVLSEEAGRRCRELTGRDALVIPNPLPKVTRPEVVRKNDQFVFLGWIIPEKGVEEILVATRRLVDEGRAPRVVIAGNKDTQWLLGRIEFHHLGAYVSFAGWVGEAEKYRLLASSLALLLPSYAEGMPLVTLEATAVGTPVIATTVGSIPEFFTDGVTARLIPPRDAEALAAAMRKALDAPQAMLALADAAARSKTLVTPEEFQRRLHAEWTRICAE